MSHRAMEERVRLQIWLDAAKHEIAAAKRAPVVDLATLKSMVRHHDDLVAQLVRHDGATS